MSDKTQPSEMTRLETIIASAQVHTIATDMLNIERLILAMMEKSYEGCLVQQSRCTHLEEIVAMFSAKITEKQEDKPS